MAVAEALARAVRARAQQRCQYCLMHEVLQGATFHIEHVVPQSKGGASALENLALACPGCNLRKASRVLAVDPETGDWFPLFHPIREAWADHFRFKSYEIEGLCHRARDHWRSRREPNPATTDPQSRRSLRTLPADFLSIPARPSGGLTRRVCW